jgi:lysophospholipase L1-like esterase
MFTESIVRPLSRRFTLAAARLLLAALTAGSVAVALAAQDGSWVATWGASPQSEVEPIFGPPPPPVVFENQSIRMVARISKGGDRIRVRLDNSQGTEPVVIGAAHIALHAAGSNTVPGTDRALTFGGRPSVTLPPGAPMLSDPVALPVPDLTELAVSIYLPKSTAALSGHTLGVQTTYLGAQGAGDQTADPAFNAAQTTLVRYYLSGIEVTSARDTSAIVTFGDSITDGFSSTIDANRRWPDRLAERLLSGGPKRHAWHREDLSVVNAGISGNRLLHHVIGPDALSRFDRDVLATTGAGYAVVMLGINDIGFSAIQVPNSPFATQAVTPDRMIQAYRQLIARARARGIKIFGATLTPFEGAGYATAEGEAKRQAVNAFIRSAGAFDGVIDFDRATRDPAQPTRLRPEYDSGDHLHPNDAGYEAMANAVDLSLFRSGRR